MGAEYVKQPCKFAYLHALNTTWQIVFLRKASLIWDADS